MSYTTIKGIWPGEKTEDIEELRNSWGSFPVVWGCLTEAYMHKERSAWITLASKDGGLWDLWKSPLVPLPYRAVLLMTFDRVYIAREHYARAAADIRAFLKDMPINPDHVNHWPHIAEYLESNPDIPGIGFVGTSVSDDLFVGDWNEEREEHDPPDWGQIWSLYDMLDEYEACRE